MALSAMKRMAVMTALQQESRDASHFIDCQLFYVSESQQVQVTALQALIEQRHLPIVLRSERFMDKLTQKRRQQLSQVSSQPILLLDDKNALSWLSAGRKSELLLQAAKMTSESKVIDATAGFGHDSLILASTGAQTIMLEQQPLMALLLLAEQQRMTALPNWQKLMSRLQIINTDAISYFENVSCHSDDTDKSIDVIYLDPMFPEDSYQDSKTGKGAKVGKHMQALHMLARPPTLEEEGQLLQSALAVVSQHSGRVIVKRPQFAPLLAKQPASECWHNEAVRFDGYFI
jgi:16S rRNA (guanine1516-N2)-methyltransferase